jgi:GH35 family endo-1,4-beta-xylanase
MKKTFLLQLALLTTLSLQGQNTPPSCVITFPHCNACFTQGKDVMIRVYASDEGGSQVGGDVTKVEFFRDSIKLGETGIDSSNTFSFTWAGVPAGNYRITAKATDNDSVSFTSAGVIITVDTLVSKAIGLSAKKGKYLGNIIPNSLRSDFNNYWNAVTAENSCKWGSVESVRDVMNWTPADRAYNHARDNHLVFRYHVLAWGSQYPLWIKSLSPADFQAEMEEYMAAVAERFPLIDQIEVLNENMYINTWNKEEHAEGTPYFREGLGGPGDTGYDWAIWLFNKARHYFPNTKLVINDFELETNPAGRNEILDLVKVLRDSGLIDGFGTQAHYFNVDGISAGTLQNALNAMAQSGLPIYVTELDLKGKSQTEASQLASYQTSFPVYWNHPAVAGITLWGYVEGSTWAQGTGILNRDGSERSAMAWLKSYMADQPDVGYPFEGVPTTVDPKVNILINGEFDYGTYAWQIDSYNDGNGTMSVVSDAAMSGEHALRICPSAPGTELWHVQVSQEAPLEAGKYYEISFMAKADVPRTMAVAMQQSVSPYNIYLEDTVSLTTEHQYFSFTFQSTTTDPSSKLKFFAGLDASCLYIDSVYCREVDVTGMIQSENHPSLTVYPNPASGMIRISGTDKEKVHIFDSVGQKVLAIPEFSGEMTIDVSSFAEGIYILQAGDAVSKFIKR